MIFILHMHKMLCLQLVLRGIKRSQGDQIRVLMPITIHHLKLLKLLLAISSTDNFDSQMFWAMTQTFFGFLCLGELSMPQENQVLTTKTRQLLTLSGFNASNYADHSYRIGAATTAAEANLPSLTKLT